MAETELLSWLRWQSIRLQCRRPGFNPCVGKISWRKAWQPTPVFLLGESTRTEESCGQQSWVHKSRTRLSTKAHMQKPTPHCKAIFLQLKHKFKMFKNVLSFTSCLYSNILSQFQILSYFIEWEVELKGFKNNVALTYVSGKHFFFFIGHTSWHVES